MVTLKLQDLQDYCDCRRAAKKKAAKKKSKKFILFIIFIIILSSEVHAVFYNLCKAIAPKYDPPILNINRNNWLQTVLIGIMSCFIVIGIIYGLGRAINSKELIAIASNNIYQNFAILILVLLIFVYNNFEEKFFEAFGKTSRNAIDATSEYLTKVWCYSVGVYTATLAGNTAVQALMEYIKALGEKEIFYFKISFKALKNEISNPLKDPFQTVLSGVMASVVITNIQIWIINNIYSIFAIFMVVGAVCRIAPFLRSFGNALIAIAIGLYIFYPLTVSMVIENIVEEYYKYRTGNRYWYNDPMAGATIAGIYQVGTGVSLGVRAGRLGIEVVEKVVKTIQGIFVPHTGGGMDGYIEGVKEKITSYVGKFIPLGSLKKFTSIFNIVLIPLVILEVLHLILNCGTFAILILGGVLPIITVIIVFGITREIGNLLGSDLTFDTIFKIL